MLTDEQKRALVDVARRSVERQVGAVTRTSERGTVPVSSSISASGAFVTIKRSGELRGCLGTLQCGASLVEEVDRCAADAASRDPRFPPVTSDELPDLSVEVSVLGPLEEIDPHDAGAITIGRHGLVAEQGFRRGLLLPQVATEHHWTVEQFLRHTCVKAGLPPDAWRRGARIYRFDAEVFGE